MNTNHQIRIDGESKNIDHELILEVFRLFVPLLSKIDAFLTVNPDLSTKRLKELINLSRNKLTTIKETMQSENEQNTKIVMPVVDDLMMKVLPELMDRFTELFVSDDNQTKGKE